MPRAERIGSSANTTSRRELAQLWICCQRILNSCGGSALISSNMLWAFVLMRCTLTVTCEYDKRLREKVSALLQFNFSQRPEPFLLTSFASHHANQFRHSLEQNFLDAGSERSVDAVINQ